MISKLLIAGSFLVLPVTGLAQNPPAPAESAAVRSGDLLITPKNGQNRDQLWRDRYDCYGWAKTQSGYDPANAGPASGREQYDRAMAACLEGKGYSVGNNGAPITPPPVAPIPRPFALHHVQAWPQIKYHPFAFSIDGGYTFATGNTNQLLDDGGNVGLGLTWFPSSILPLGIRIDGSYSRFDARPALLDQSGVGYSFGHEALYGGDADLQFDLAHGSSRSKFYLFGGAGWYREQTVLKQVSFESGNFCGFFSCGPGFGPVITAEERSTSPWRTSWNAGVGWESALSDNASFFVEARYLRITPINSNMGFVPVRFGFRF
jgi:opacity protein-like surface antigen